MTILVIDDEPTMPRLFSQRYRKEIRDGSLKFLFASSGEEALAVLDRGFDSPSLILSDINMPGMSGLAFLETLRLRDLAIPVYMISAYDGSEYETKALAQGAQGFLAKPMRFDELNRLIVRHGPPVAKLPRQNGP